MWWKLSLLTVVVIYGAFIAPVYIRVPFSIIVGAILWYILIKQGIKLYKEMKNDVNKMSDNS